MNYALVSKKDYNFPIKYEILIKQFVYTWFSRFESPRGRNIIIDRNHAIRC